MGNYLLLNCIDKICWMGDSGGGPVSPTLPSSSSSSSSMVRAIFPRLILDAPDVPTWFFADMVTRLCLDGGGGEAHGVVALHLFNHHDQAVEAGRLRRAIAGVYPGNGLVLPTSWPLPAAAAASSSSSSSSSAGHLEAVACDGARSACVNHDYGQVDGMVLLTQRDFLCGVPPNLRLLDLINDERGTTGVAGAKCWKLRLGK